MIRNTSNILTLILLFYAFTGLSQQAQKPSYTIPANFRVSEEEMRLYRMINDYRRRYDLPSIPLSLSLSYVASAHVKDLFFHHPDQEPCNFHSWSDKGPWKAFCYPRDENKKNSVWDKPKEFTPYKDKGYEIVYWENNQVDIDSIINFWRSVNYFNSFLTNTGKWQGTKWEAIGIGIYENYACAWFGQVPDPSGPPLINGDVPFKNDSEDALKKPETARANVKAPAIKDSGSVPITPALTPGGRPLTYYIIVRSNVPLRDTTKVIKLYSGKGFTQVESLVKAGKARISVFKTSDRATALARLKEIKVQYKDAWLLKL